MINKIGQATKLINQGITYYFLGDVTIIVKNDRITVQSNSQLALLDRLTIPEANIYDIVFDNLSLSDKKGATTAVELVEIWITLGFFSSNSVLNDINNVDVSKNIIYYTGVEAGNPSGSIDNIKQIEYIRNAVVILTNNFTYDLHNRIINTNYV